MPFPRPCSLCNQRFEPSGRFARLCPECRKKAQQHFPRKKYYCKEHHEGFMYVKNWDKHLKKYHSKNDVLGDSSI